jgi:hypothetical protein
MLSVPLGALLALRLLGRGHRGLAMLGLVAGAGVTIAAIGAINLRPYRACSGSSGRAAAALHDAAARGVNSCGGVDGRAWLTVGAALALTAALAHLVALYRPRPPARGRPKAAV